MEGQPDRTGNQMTMRFTLLGKFSSTLDFSQFLIAVCHVLLVTHFDTNVAKFRLGFVYNLRRLSYNI